MNTVFWGKSGWKFLHALTFIYPEQPTFTDKVKMRDFMNSLQFILPCKYCRSSFATYIKSVSIDEYLESRNSIIEWLYKIHNKINKKLRSQGFCNHSNPELDTIIHKYTEKPDSIVKTIIKLYNSKTSISSINHTLDNDNDNDNDDGLQKAINYICNIGAEFLGSIIFNYQGYYTNCHTSDEKTRIITVYNTFFNAIRPMICSFLEHSSFCIIDYNCSNIYKNNSKTKTKTNKKQNKHLFNIRYILQQNQPYTKLIEWFYKCRDLCTMQTEFSNIEEYKAYFEKHIVSSCNNPKIDKTKLNSCRKNKKLHTKKITHSNT